jgi:hypothetical protein
MRALPHLHLVLVCAAIAAAGASRTTLHLRPLRLRASVLAAGVNEKGGFGQIPKPKSAPKPITDATKQPAAGTPSATPLPGARLDSSTPNGDVDSVLARAGIKPSSSFKTRGEVPMPSIAQEPMPEPGALAQVPIEVQNQIEQVLVTFAGLALVFFITCGFAVVGDAYITVSKTTPPPFVLAIIQALSPKFTPGLGGVLLCSVTLGIFKQVQFSEGVSGLIYKEED